MATLAAGVTVLILCDSEPTSQQALPRSAILHCSSETTSCTGSWTEVTVPMVQILHIIPELTDSAEDKLVQSSWWEWSRDSWNMTPEVSLDGCCYSVATTDNNHALKPPIPYNNCVGVPISRQITVGSTPVWHSVLNLKSASRRF